MSVARRLPARCDIAENSWSGAGYFTVGSGLYLGSVISNGLSGGLDPDVLDGHIGQCGHGAGAAAGAGGVDLVDGDLGLAEQGQDAAGVGGAHAPPLTELRGAELGDAAHVVGFQAGG